MEDVALYDDLDEAIRHCTAGLRALETARSTAQESGKVYGTHIYIASVEMAHAIETSMKVALRSL